jgi:hypothetical protein
VGLSWHGTTPHTQQLSGRCDKHDSCTAPPPLCSPLTRCCGCGFCWRLAVLGRHTYAAASAPAAKSWAYSRRELLSSYGSALRRRLTESSQLATPGGRRRPNQLPSPADWSHGGDRTRLLAGPPNLLTGKRDSARKRDGNMLARCRSGTSRVPASRHSSTRHNHQEAAGHRPARPWDPVRTRARQSR